MVVGASAHRRGKDIRVRMIRQAWDRFSLYLPVLLMGLLALGTWWLVRNAPVPV